MVGPWLQRYSHQALDSLGSGLGRSLAFPAGQPRRPPVVQGFLPYSHTLRRPQHCRAQDLPSESELWELPWGG